MTGREKIRAAFSEKGTPEIPAVICYQGIYFRDHWDELTGCPWWYVHAPEIDRQLEWLREAIRKTGQDWLAVGPFYPGEKRDALSIEVRPEGVFKVDSRTGKETRLEPPRVGGWTVAGEVQSIRPERPAETPGEIDAAVPAPVEPDFGDGRADLARAMLAEFGDLYPITHVVSPLWRTYKLWGFEGMMMMVGSRPELVERACRRYLEHALLEVRQAKSLGAEGVWIEECLTDMIGPAAYESLCLPFVRAVVEEIRACGMKSIHYYCGDPAGKWDLILSTGADALALEEGKKGFTIDMGDVAERVNGRCTLLGNLDAVGVLQNGTDDDLRAETGRQLAAGRRNGSRFIMSLGSPVTPETPVARVRRYCDLVHELGS